MSQPIPLIEPDIYDTIRTNYVGLASYVVLVWDHIDTFPDEVELIWKGETKSLFVWLFIFNRYFTPLGFILNLFGKYNPQFIYLFGVKHLKQPTCPQSGPSKCAQFVRFEGCTVAIAVEVVGLMMLLRVRALYPHQKWITNTLAGILIFETVLNIWLISRAEPVIHNPDSGINACSMIFDPSISTAASASAWVPLLYDTIIFVLTLYRTVPPIRREEASYIVKRLLEDGLLYYSVILSVTLVLTVMIIASPPGMKNIAAQTEQLITVAMMSRITLNLKKAGVQFKSDDPSASSTILFDRRRKRPSASANLLDGTFAISVLPSPLPLPSQSSEPKEQIIQHPIVPRREPV